MGIILREINRQMKAAAREAERREREQERSRAAAIREFERARKADERAAAQLARATAAERKRLEKEAKAAHIAAMEAQAESMNAELADKYEQLDSLLNATLEVDDFWNSPDSVDTSWAMICTQGEVHVRQALHG